MSAAPSKGPLRAGNSEGTPLEGDAKRLKMDGGAATSDPPKSTEVAEIAAESSAFAPRGVAPDEALKEDAAKVGTDAVGYEYLDHTADIQLHSWGGSLEESFEQVVLAMFGYMTELDKVEEDDSQIQEFEVEGHDYISLLYNLMDEFLFRFVTEPFVVCRRVKILELDSEAFKIRVQGFGEVFDLTKHPQGTEVKAITYSNMQIHHDKPRKDVYVIVDI
eukprot:m.453207 g.453207  ORF g.453207 m.453207 type:complete len:219 (-) comp20455_c0_seq1:386-1042(-)